MFTEISSNACMQYAIPYSVYTRQHNTCIHIVLFVWPTIESYVASMPKKVIINAIRKGGSTQSLPAHLRGTAQLVHEYTRFI